eukprot:TRINITY_DN1915_c0_g1_i1.p1 TRINITY_DN1915_c0_g1~~TRINITY_DN1915_c0_g1_i1.p1  ORF type:complete len:309 (+),score=74.23 TRINITY_DN1915_c0_g1_i1:319-1245(+)
MNPVDLIRTSPKYSFGNYSKYYSMRHKERFQDPRLQIFTRDYFLNRECLDIGCNDGSLTIMLAIKYFPKKIIGVDVDYKLINKAIHNMRYFEKQQRICKGGNADTKGKKEIEDENKKIQQIMQKMSNFPKSFLINMGLPVSWGNSEGDKNRIVAQQVDEALTRIEEERKSDIEFPYQFPDNIGFRVENYVSTDAAGEQFDTILCLSTSKWIHLNYGDLGIEKLFTKVSVSLRSGGYFIFEPQDWRSYKKKKNISDEFKANYEAIRIRPKDFEAYLTNLGMILISKITPESISTVVFKRTIYILSLIHI